MSAPGPGNLVRIDLGCGRAKIPGTIGLDNAAVPGVDVLGDMRYGLPFRDNSADALYAYHVLEHFDDFLGIMGEIWRVCRHGATVHIKVPHASSPYMTWKDPTHRRGLMLATFTYFDDSTFAGSMFSYYSPARFLVEEAMLNFTLTDRRDDPEMSGMRRFLTKVFSALANRNRGWQDFCERFWGPLVGIEEAVVMLRAQKD
jgi:SAM-dependent methyltransferase